MMRPALLLLTTSRAVGMRPASLMLLTTSRGFHPLVSHSHGIVPHPADACPRGPTLLFSASSSSSSSSSSSNLWEEEIGTSWEEEEEDDDDDDDNATDDDLDLVGKEEAVVEIEMEMEQQQKQQEETTAQEDALLQEYHEWIKAIEKAQKALAKKQASLENEKTKAQTLEDTVARAQLIVNNLYLFHDNNSNNKHGGQPKVYQVVDWEQNGQEVEVTLDPRYESASAEADALFAQARKLKRGSQVVQELLVQVQRASKVLVDGRADLESAWNDNNNKVDPGRLRLVQARLARTASTTQFQEPVTTAAHDDHNNHAQGGTGKSSRAQQQQPQQPQQPQQANKEKKMALGTPASNVRKLVTPHGATVLVGRNRRGNEYLTFQAARQNDIWMHARGTPGAHVLVLDRRGSVKPTDRCLEFAAHLAAFYSDSRAEHQVPVTLAEPKHLLKPKKAPLGAVKLRHEGQVLYGCPDKVPPQLVEARAQSGMAEEYRSADKAKHRKQTLKQQQQQRDKKRSQQRQRRNSSNKQDEDAS